LYDGLEGVNRSCCNGQEDGKESHGRRHFSILYLISLSYYGDINNNTQAVVPNGGVFLFSHSASSLIRLTLFLLAGMNHVEHSMKPYGLKNKKNGRRHTSCCRGTKLPYQSTEPDARLPHVARLNTTRQFCCIVGCSYGIIFFKTTRPGLANALQ
jgi:hypothetical protein